MEQKGLGITITQHILDQQRKNPEATGAFTTLMNELIVAAKVISREVNKAGLVDILGPTGKINIQNEKVQKLDVFANRAIIERMQHIGQLWCMGSEEDPDLIRPISDDVVINGMQAKQFVYGFKRDFSYRMFVPNWFYAIGGIIKGKIDDRREAKKEMTSS